ncbi:NAD(P)H-dependent oxidoreductase [Nonomuraea sp. KM88]|uniref:NAD(P)H-dependent oxidoreductase n=1 Tax=Nonomuraea sp. KM88 TaxID=3457427 RepID=UPI003FCD3BC2
MRHRRRRPCAAAVGAADAFVVTPEYNRGFPAPLKQAIDFAYDEWRAAVAADRPGDLGMQQRGRVLPADQLVRRDVLDMTLARYPAGPTLSHVGEGSMSGCRSR